MSSGNLEVGDRAENGFCSIAGAFHRRVGQNDGELFASVAASDIFGADIRLKDVGERLEHGISGGVAVRVIEALEVVGIEHQYSHDLLATARTRHLTFQRDL